MEAGTCVAAFLLLNQEGVTRSYPIAFTGENVRGGFAFGALGGLVLVSMVYSPWVTARVNTLGESPISFSTG